MIPEGEVAPTKDDRVLPDGGHGGGGGALQEPPVPENWELAKRVFERERMNVKYTAVMRRFTSLSDLRGKTLLPPVGNFEMRWR